MFIPDKSILFGPKLYIQISLSSFVIIVCTFECDLICESNTTIVFSVFDHEPTRIFKYVGPGFGSESNAACTLLFLNSKINNNKLNNIYK